MKRTKETMLRVASAMTVGMMFSTDAFAQFSGGTTGGGNNFSNVTDKLVGSSSKLPNLITTMAYIGGIGMGVAGIMKLKAHVDNPGQAPMKDGLIRLAAGGGLLSLPMIIESMTNTVGAGGTGATLTKVTAITY